MDDQRVGDWKRLDLVVGAILADLEQKLVERSNEPE